MSGSTAAGGEFSIGLPAATSIVATYSCCFARVRCPECASEYLVPFPCQTRAFCPSCAAKRASTFGVYLAEKVAAEVGHAQWVFTIPKRLRPYFLHNRELLGTLSQAAWQTVAEMVDIAANGNELVRPGMVAVIHPRDLLAQIPDLFRDRGRECNDAGPTAISTRSLSTNRVGPLIVSLMMPPQRRGLSLQAERRRTSENPTPS